MNYEALLQSIQQTHSNAKSAAAGAVNRQLVCRNWLIGAYLVEFEQNGEDRAVYGSQLLKRVANDLAKISVPGSGVRMLERMRRFFLDYPQLSKEISSPPVTKSISALKINELHTTKAASQLSENLSYPSPLPTQQLMRLSWTHIVELLAIDDPWKHAVFEEQAPYNQ